jgi:hypothetical protein
MVYPEPTVMLVVEGLKLDVSSADCQIKSFAVAGLRLTLRLDEDPSTSTMQLVL